jgi:transposase-like protein
MNKQDSAEFKLEAVKRLEKSGEILTKVAANLGVKPTTMQGWVNKYRIAKLCKVLCVSRSSYYAWDKRPESQRTKENNHLLTQIQNIYEKSMSVFGSVKITKIINAEGKKPINHKRVEHIMSVHGIRSRVSKSLRQLHILIISFQLLKISLTGISPWTNLTRKW